MNMLIKLGNMIAKYLLTTTQNFIYGQSIKCIFYLQIYKFIKLLNIFELDCTSGAVVMGKWRVKWSFNPLTKI